MVDMPIEVWMQSGPERVKGYHWPKHASGEYEDFVAVEPKSDVIVHIPNGPTLELHGKLLTMTLSENRVEHISIAMSSDVVSFQQAVMDLRNAALELGVSFTERSLLSLAKWATMSPDPTGKDTVWGKVPEGPFITRGEDLAPDITPEFIIRAHLMRGGFFLTFRITWMGDPSGVQPPP